MVLCVCNIVLCHLSGVEKGIVIAKRYSSLSVTAKMRFVWYCETEYRLTVFTTGLTEFLDI